MLCDNRDFTVTCLKAAVREQDQKAGSNFGHLAACGVAHVSVYVDSSLLSVSWGDRARRVGVIKSLRIHRGRQG